MTDDRESGGRFEGDVTRGGEPRSFADGRYAVRSRLGAGNFATVYLAHDERLDVLVAIKLLADRWSWEPEVRSRFVQEARLLRSINDPLVVQIRDIAETSDGRPYLVMDYADRGTLERRLLEVAQRGAAPDTESVRIVARGIAEALAALHRRRIAHRDIKPSNLLITRIAGAPVLRTGAAILRPDERLVLGDLGLAKDLTVGSGLTIGAGTAGYMAPEQARPGARIDTRTDIFGASALLAEVASGQSPDPIRRYSGGRLELGSPLPDSIPPELRVALAHGLDADPDLRPQTIDIWLNEVDTALGPVSSVLTTGPLPIVSATSPGTTSRAVVTSPTRASAAQPGTPASTKRKRRTALVAVAVGVVVLLGVGVALAAGGGGGGTAGGTSTTTAASASSVVSTSVSTSSTTAASTSVSTSTSLAPRSTSPVPTSATTTVAATTSPTVTAATTTTQAPPDTLPPPTVTVSGPTVITAGVQAFWTVQQENAVSGTWTLTGPVQPSNPDWTPSSTGFGGTWNQPGGPYTLTLTVVNGAGVQASSSISFTVT